MSQRLSVEAPRQSLRTDTLSPVLQIALGSLDVQLEAELARYRRQRVGRVPSSPKGWGRQQARKPLDLISVGSPKAGSSAGASSAGRVPNSPQAELKALAKPAVATAKTPTDSKLAPEKTAPQKAAPQKAILGLDRSQSPIPTIVGPLSSQLALIDRGESANLASNFAAEVDSSLGEGLTDLQVQRGDMVSASPIDPYDYLESSEELLRSLSEPEETIAPPQRRLTDTLFTPLGIGSVLLLLLSISTLGLLLLNPLALQRLGFNRQPLPATTASNPSATTSTPAASASSRSALPNSPNLAAKEFVDLNLNNLSGVKTGAGSVIPAPSTLASPQLSPVGVTPQSVVPLPIVTPMSPASVGIAANADLPPLPRVVLRPQPMPAPQSFTPMPPQPQVFSAPPTAPIAAPEPVAPSTPAADTTPIKTTNAPVVNRPQRVINTPVAPTPAPLTPAPTTPAATAVPAGTPRSSVPTAPTAQERYYVVVNYDNDRTLEQSRQAVPDAFLRRFPDERSRIQVGSFNDSAAASGLVQKLQQQGIPAEVYRP